MKKKIFLGLASVITVATPVVAVVACGEDKGFKVTVAKGLKEVITTDTSQTTRYDSSWINSNLVKENEDGNTSTYLYVYAGVLADQMSSTFAKHILDYINGAMTKNPEINQVWLTFGDDEHGNFTKYMDAESSDSFWYKSKSERDAIRKTNEQSVLIKEQMVFQNEAGKTGSNKALIAQDDIVAQLKALSFAHLK